MDNEENHVHGRSGEVIRQLIEQVSAGDISPEQMVELVAGMAAITINQHAKNVTIPFRLALIAQGYEEQALKLKDVTMVLSTAGAMFQYGLDESDPAEWMEGMDPVVNRAFLQASVWVLRAGLVDATIDDDNTHIEIHGMLNADKNPDIEQAVSAFVEELDREFPTTEPPKRTGDWW